MSAANPLIRSDSALLASLNIWMYDNRPPFFVSKAEKFDLEIEDTPSSFTDEFLFTLPLITDPDLDKYEVSFSPKLSSMDFSITFDKLSR